jgi:hypothetical protein
MTDEQKDQIREAAREVVREYHSTDDVQVDPDADVIGAGDPGYWVAAWIFVRKPEEENE